MILPKIANIVDGTPDIIDFWCHKWLANIELDILILVYDKIQRCYKLT